MPFFYYCFVKSGTSFKPLRLSFVDIGNAVFLWERYTCSWIVTVFPNEHWFIAKQIVDEIL